MKNGALPNVMEWGLLWKRATLFGAHFKLVLRSSDYKYVYFILILLFTKVMYYLVILCCDLIGPLLNLLPIST